MGLLPYLNSTRDKTRKQIVAFRGINYSDMFQDGDLRESLNLSARRYPYLSTRRVRTKLTYSDVTAMTAWEKLVTVKGKNVYYGGELLKDKSGYAYEVAEGEKQFAVVNTKLVIWPDKAYVDLSDGTFGTLEATAATKKATITANTIQSDIYKFVQKTKHTFTGIYNGNVGTWTPTVYSYGVDRSAIVWNAESGWELPTPTLKCVYKNGKGQPKDLAILSPNDIIIPNSANGLVVGNARTEELPDETENNANGYFGLVTKVEQVEETLQGAKTVIYYDIYSAEQENPLFGDSFRVGDRVDISGTQYGYNDREKAEITAIDDTANTLTFPDDTFRVYKLSAEVETDLAAGNYFMRKGTDNTTALYFTATEIIKAGAVLIGDASTITVWDTEAKTALTYYSVASSTLGNATVIQSTAFSDEVAELTIKRPIPDLDYICESSNRLFGCSNADKTVYASELGDPTRFYGDPTLTTGAYAVAVGTEGSFTGCCKYASAVLFWKETHLHKLLGTSPQDYALYEYELEGVQEGSYKSLQTINNVVYYLGANGVYAYAGGVPSLVSDVFGEKYFKDGVAGNDGDTYYLSAQGGSGHSLFTFDPSTGFWYREDGSDAVDFARMGKALYMLTDKGEIWLMDARAEDPEIEWMAQFAPFHDTAEGRKMFSKIILRVEMPKGAHLRAEVRSDGGRWREVGKVVGKEADSIPIQIPLNRCDEFEVRLSGRGACAIKAMVLEYLVGSDR